MTEYTFTDCARERRWHDLRARLKRIAINTAAVTGVCGLVWVVVWKALEGMAL